MGMYTQVRGWLNIDSIGYGNDRLIKAEKLLEQAKEDFENDNTLVDYYGNKLARKCEIQISYAIGVAKPV